MSGAGLKKMRGRARAILIAGPTASGKSSVALALAERLGGVVINADSMQVYEDLAVLTARPTPADEARAPHLLYGVLPARDPYSTGRWLADVGVVLADAEQAGQVPIIAGGTGLYFKALLEGLSPVPDIPPTVRERWRAAAATRDGAALHALLAERDPLMAARLRPSDPQRIVRALEVVTATGRSLAEWQSEPGRPLLDEAGVARFVIAPPREALAARIEARFGAMLGTGALDEVAALAAQDLDPGLPAMRALGVAPLMAHLRGELTLEAAAAQAVTETRRYAKRQMTWARRHMVAWEWIVAQDSESLAEVFFANIDENPLITVDARRARR